MPKIHKTAIVHSKAKIADNVFIGPFCIVGPNVTIGLGTKLIGHCNITGHTTIGINNIVYNFVSLGTEPQAYEFNGLVSYLKIGNNNTFREGFTANVGTKEGSKTVIGDNCYFMTNSHIAHNCQIGNNVVMVNCSGLAGYTELADHCLISGMSGTHQFVRIGRFAMMSGSSVASVDIPPFVIADGRNGAIKVLNIIGLKRNGFSLDTIIELKKLFKIFFRSELNVTNALKKIDSEVKMISEVKEFIDFVRSSKRGIATGRDTRRNI